jgi:hypothetical protein
VSYHALWKIEIPTCLLFKLARRIGHIQPATTIANRHSIRQDVLAKPHRRLRIERFHKPIAKNVSSDHIRVAGTEDQIAVCVNSRPGDISTLDLQETFLFDYVI